MEWKETIRTAVAALNARRMRSLLTMLGILIGIAAVMLTVGLGQGAQASITSQINSLGSNLLIVSPSSSTSSGGFRGGGSAVSTLTTADAAMLADPTVAPDIAAVAPVSSTSGSLQSSSTTWTSTVVGTTPEWLTVRAREVASGRFFTAAELDGSSNVAVIGSETATELFSDGSPVGQTISVNGQSFTVIGVLSSAGSSGVSNEDDTVLVPLTTFASRLSTSGNANSVSSIYLSGKDADTLSAAYQQVKTSLLASHGVTADSADFSVSTQASLVETATSITGILTLLLGGIAGISLLVGGIGVMNIMLVSVIERTGEIGLRMAVGARRSDIMQQFLIEASLVCFIGGALGIGLALAVGYGFEASGSQMRFIYSGEAFAVAIACSTLIGLTFGFLPARNAAKLDPVAALARD